jgi:hypothetical protein
MRLARAGRARTTQDSSWAEPDFRASASDCAGLSRSCSPRCRSSAPPRRSRGSTPSTARSRCRRAHARRRRKAQFDALWAEARSGQDKQLCAGRRRQRAGRRAAMHRLGGAQRDRRRPLVLEQGHARHRPRIELDSRSRRRRGAAQGRPGPDPAGGRPRRPSTRQGLHSRPAALRQSEAVRSQLVSALRTADTALQRTIRSTRRAPDRTAPTSCSRGRAPMSRRRSTPS